MSKDEIERMDRIADIVAETRRLTSQLSENLDTLEALLAQTPANKEIPDAGEHTAE